MLDGGLHEPDEGRCRLNCRTPREIFDAGVACGRHGTDPDKVWRELRERKRRQETETKSRQKRLRIQLGSNLRREGGGSNRVPKV